MKKDGLILLPLAVSFFCAGTVSAARADDAYHPYYYTVEQSGEKSGGNYQTYTVSSAPARVAVPVIAPATEPAYIPPAATAPLPTRSVSDSYSYQPAPAAAPQPTTRTPDSYDYQPAPSNAPASDVRVAPYQTPKAHDGAHDPDRASSFGKVLPGKPMGVGTLSGWQIGLQVSNYRYNEHDVADHEFMHIVGPNFGATAEYAHLYPSGYFWGMDARITYGMHNYNGGDIDINTSIFTPSTRSGDNDWMIELRSTFGHDFIFPGALWNLTDIGLSPYIGLGFRYLSNSPTEQDTNGVSGYDRGSHYFYLPVGITPRFGISDTQRISINMEYDQLLYGWQFSGLAALGYGDITNTQRGGYGLRGNIMYEWSNWAVGPFAYYWNINQSSTDCAGGLCGAEPHNQTIEYGLQGRYRF